MTTEQPASRSARPAVLITGANRGIGRATAEALAADHHLLLAGRDEQALAALAAQLPSAQPVVAELTDHAATAAAVAALDLPGGLAGLVHCAGILVNGTVEELSAADWERNFAVNVTAVSELTRLLLPALREARGTVVAVNSGSGYNAKGERGAYSASKFALRAWTDALRQEETAHGVRVSSVHPGRVDTDMQQELRAAESGAYETEKYLRPATVAAAIGFALRAPAEAVIATIDLRPRAIG
ncbi:short chain dehydrogenase [Brachybacterium vulturis]|uniref:Short chain dehydrogenase n=1 Tax=Brachybacterium vulturis TaxID=2017484 RepID=A0A291GM34_9MICO|nr:SDR family oxidoreductase [Brachybacterium vulturis]ATG51096.1 short chain dehydrogenase [Brachybacterium vulturis]